MPAKSVRSYIAKHSVDWLHKGGFTVVPICVGLKNAEAKALFHTVDALYFQGGPFYEKHHMHLAHLLLEQAVLAKKPVWGSCHGFQMLIALIGNVWPLDSLKGMRDTEAPLKPYDTAGSPLIKAMTPYQKRTFYKTSGVPFVHQYGITVEHFLQNKVLNAVFRIVTSTKDKKGTEYVSMVEGRTLPLWGVQFHPEYDPHLHWMASFFADQVHTHHKGPKAALPELVACPKVWEREGLDLQCYRF
jgi:gamma-glutamyl hydrolase